MNAAVVGVTIVFVMLAIFVLVGIKRGWIK